MKKQPKENCRIGTVGGQAVIEGVMMKQSRRYSVAVRTPGGKIKVQSHEYVSVGKRYPVLALPLIRGVVNMVEMMIISFRTLNYSADIYASEEENESADFAAAETEPDKTGLTDTASADSKEKKDDKKNGEGSGLGILLTAISVLLGLAMGVFLFMFLPSFVTSQLNKLFSDGLGWWKNLIEGLLKVVIFIGYLLLALLMKDIRRTFEYHGAEHKTIFCYEAGEELTPENVKKYKRFHPRCGTSFIVVILIIGIVFSSLPFITWNNALLRTLVKLLFLPVTVAVGYEYIRFAGRHDNIVTRILSAPGLWLQRITTREPDLDQIEVAIRALKSALAEEFPDSPDDDSQNTETESVSQNPSESEAPETEKNGDTSQESTDTETEKITNPDTKRLSLDENSEAITTGVESDTKKAENEYNK